MTTTTDQHKHSARPRFDARDFPQYGKLTAGERLFLRTCCYLPPRPHRARTLEAVLDLPRYVREYDRGFGPELWAAIAGKRVLDLGCGEGGHVLAMAERGAAHVTGVDVEHFFALAEEESRRRADARVTFVHGHSSVLPDAAFDVVVSHDSFEHFEEPEAMLAEMMRLVRPGGRILIKFGKPWRSPWGRHMSGTLRKDRPWVHLVVPERNVMRVHSVYHDDPVLYEHYADLAGGLNKMTVGRCRYILGARRDLRVDSFRLTALYGLRPLTAVPVLNEFFASEVRAICTRL